MVREATVTGICICALIGFMAIADAAPGFMGEHVVLQRAVNAPADDSLSAGSANLPLPDQDDVSTVVARSSVSLSSDGFRALSQDGIRQSLTSYTIRRTWLLDRIRRVALEIHLPEEPPVPSDLPQGMVPTGMFATTPCTGVQSRRLAPTRWRGRDVVPHDCLDADGAVTATHIFSEPMGLVIRTASPNGRVEEFHHIKQVELPAEHFVLPPGFRVVDLLEFRRGAGPIAAPSALQ